MSGRSGTAAKKKSVSKSQKAGLQFPVGRLARFLKNGRYAKRIGSAAPVYLAAVLEYLAAEVVTDSFHHCLCCISAVLLIWSVILIALSYKFDGHFCC
ncbi:hypothetical protein Mapa_014434 [Marchantia paleacea]|nr:hypothetical protein Mapa_014434 [Marchantia paleacea]